MFGDVAGDLPPGLRCADDVVQPRGRRWMNPRLSPKRFEPGEGGGAPVIPGEGMGGAALVEGLRLRMAVLAGGGTLAKDVEGGVPTGEGLEEEEVEVDP